MEHGHERRVGGVVLHASAVTTFVFVGHFVFVVHHHLVVLVHVYLATLAHFFQFGTRPTRLNAQAFVHLRFENLKLVESGFVHHAQSAIATGTIRKPYPEVGKLLDDPGIVVDGGAYVTRFLVKYTAIEYGHEVVWLHLDDEVEVGNGPIIVAQLQTK